jgi:hypothetical protein
MGRSTLASQQQMPIWQPLDLACVRVDNCASEAFGAATPRANYVMTRKVRCLSCGGSQACSEFSLVFSEHNR